MDIKQYRKKKNTTHNLPISIKMLYSHDKNITSLLVFFSYSAITLLINFSIQYLFVSEEIYYQTFGEQLTIQRIDKFLEISTKWQWIGYTILPIIILSRTFYTSIFLYIGIFYTELKIEFSKLFKLALLADFVYVLSGLSKLIILIFFKEVSTLEDLQFTPLSIMELFDTDDIEPLFINPLSLLNIFELGYFLALASLLVGAIKEANGKEFSFRKSLKLVTASYGSGLLLLMLIVMFITINIS